MVRGRNEQGVNREAVRMTMEKKWDKKWARLRMRKENWKNEDGW
jgi:hypothetical protein